MHNRLRVCIPTSPAHVGGPTSFYRKLVSELAKRGVEVTNNLDDWPYQVILLINGTRRINKVLYYKKRGARVVQRLGGLNWLHRRLPVTWREYLLAEVRNINMWIIRKFLADHIVYQSRFVKDWWNSRYGVAKAPSKIIYNGVDLALFSPDGPAYDCEDDVCIISVEGAQGVDKFDTAVKLAYGLRRLGMRVRLLMFGHPWKNAQERYSRHSFVVFKGVVPNADLPYFYRGADVYVATDIIAACPNSVIEALACGTPVIGYKAGALPELVDESAGRCVEYLGNPWNLEPPNNEEALVRATLEILEAKSRFRRSARELAERRFGQEHMGIAYYHVLFP